MQSARPLHDWVAFLDVEDVTEAGLVLAIKPGSGSAYHGVVVSTGPGRITDDGKLIEPRVKKGDKITIHPHAEIITVTMPGWSVDAPDKPTIQRVLMVCERNIVCVIEEQHH